MVTGQIHATGCVFCSVHKTDAHVRIENPNNSQQLSAVRILLHVLYFFANKNCLYTEEKKKKRIFLILKIEPPRNIQYYTSS